MIYITMYYYFLPVSTYLLVFNYGKVIDPTAAAGDATATANDKKVYSKFDKYLVHLSKDDQFDWNNTFWQINH